MFDQNISAHVVSNHFEIVHKGNIRQFNSSEQSVKKIEQQQKTQILLQSKKNSFTLQWKKEIKHYFNCLRKYRRLSVFGEKQIWLKIALRMFQFKKKSNKQQIFSSSLIEDIIYAKSSINSKSICAINKIQKNHNFLILVLNFRISKTKKQQIDFDIELISMQRKIYYKKINLKKWQQIHNQIDLAKNLTNNLIMLVQNKNILINLLQKNSEFLSLIHKFDQLQSINLPNILHVISKVGGQIQQNTDANIIQEIIQQYKFIKQSLIKLMRAVSYMNLTIDELLALTISFNIISTIPISRESPLPSQIETFYPLIVKCFLKEYEREQIKINSVAASEFHFPFTLQNAQICWKCKIKRGYICCPTCSKNEKKNLSLCLGCYQSHHLQFKRTNSLCNQQMEETVNIWNDVNSQVESIVQQQLSNILIFKSEQTG